MKEKLYHYKATVLRVIDGDTIDVNPIKLGFNLEIAGPTRLRFNRINAPEKTGVEKPLGIKSKEHLVALLPPGTEIIINTVSTDSFGRWLSELFLLDGENINDHMVKEGFAAYKKY